MNDVKVIEGEMENGKERVMDGLIQDIFEEYVRTIVEDLVVDLLDDKNLVSKAGGESSSELVEFVDKPVQHAALARIAGEEEEKKRKSSILVNRMNVTPRGYKAEELNWRDLFVPLKEEIKYYKNYFYMTPHRNFVGYLANGKMPAALTIGVLPTEPEGCMYRVLLWRKEAIDYFKLSIATTQLEHVRPEDLDVRTASAKAVCKLIEKRAQTMLKILKHVKPFLGDFAPLAKMDALHTSKTLLDIEAKMMVNYFKFGVLYCRQGQLTENEFFNNCDPSIEFTRFMDCLGERIRLLDWPHYRGGLNVRDDSTGTHSYYTSWNGNGIMFHVSTLLPFFPLDAQQIERKRHLGNDIVLIIFMDGDTPFDPSCISSDFNHCFILALPISFLPPKFHYDI